MTDTPIDAEVIPNAQALAVRPATGLPTVQDLEQQFALAVRQRELLSEYIKKQLVPGKHFYQRGTQKPSLAKEGAEIILLPHNLAPDYEQTGGPDAPPADGRPYQITVKCILRRKGDPDSFVGSGIGSAGSEKQLRDGSYQPRQGDKYICHNATLKMAQKSAMIAATINSTAASEFFTQDLEPEPAQKPAEGKRGSKDTTPPVKTPPAPTGSDSRAAQPAQPSVIAFPTAKHRERMIEALKAAPGGQNRQTVTEYFRKVGPPHMLLPTEELEHLPLRFVPATKDQMFDLSAKIARFSAGDPAVAAFPPHPDPAPPAAPAPPAPPVTALPKRPAVPDDEAWRGVIVPVPPKGIKRDVYLKHPETIGELFDLRHGQDEEAQAARQRLWGFVNHYEAKPWVGKDGKQRPPSATDVKFREALDAFALWFERNHPDEKL